MKSASLYLLTPFFLAVFLTTLAASAVSLSPSASRVLSEEEVFDLNLTGSFEHPQLKEAFVESVNLKLAPLLRAGTKNLGRLKLNEFQDRLSELQIRAVPGPIRAGKNLQRSTATFSRIQKTVLISYEEWMQTEASLRPLVAMHEALMALNYNDNDYQLTVLVLTLSAFAQMDANPNDEESRKLLHVNRMRELCLSAPVLQEIWNLTQTSPRLRTIAKGTITGHGGGDSRMATVKVLLLSVAGVLTQIPNPISDETLAKIFYLILDASIENNELEQTDHLGNGLSAQSLMDATQVHLDRGGRLQIRTPKAQFLRMGNEQQFELNYKLLRRIVDVSERVSNAE